MIFHNFQSGLILSRQGGAAWAEFIVVAGFVLVPMFTLIPMVGKYIDTRHKAEQAARYASWERTAWFEPGNKMLNTAPIKAVKTKDQIRYEVQARILAGADESIHSGQGIGPGKEKTDVMQNFSNRNTGKYETLLKAFGKKSNKDVYIAHTSKQDEPPGGVNKGINQILKVAGIGGFDLNTKGLYTSRIKIDVLEPDWFKEFSGVDVAFSTHHTLLTDGWGAGGTEHNKELVQGLLPTKLFDNKAFDAALDIISIVPIAKELKSSSLVFGHVDVEQVPGHRLSKGKVKYK